MKKNVLCLALSASLLLGLAAGCGGTTGGQTDGPDEARDSVVIALSGDISSMNPFDNAVLIDRYVRTNYYESLVYYNGSDFEPLLAESWEISPDGLEYVFHLKDGVSFHNGAELTADDVVFSLEQAKASPSWVAETASISAIEATDDRTVKVTLSETYAPFMLSVASKVCIINKAYTEEGGEDSYSQPVGTGPYRFVDRVMGSEFNLEAFEDWHGGEVPIQHATYKVIAEASSAVMSLESGDIDLTYTMPSISVASLKENSAITVSEVPTQGSGYLVYNLEVAPFNDLNFRKALGYAVDRDTIITAALDGIGTKSTSVWGPTTVGYTGNYTWPEYDMEQAKEYLAQSSYNGEPIQFIVGNETYKRLAVVVQESLNQLGITTEIEMMESNAWITDMKNGNYQMSFVINTVEADADLWSTRFATTGIGVSNMSHLSRSDVDELFELGRATTDTAERCTYYDDIAKILIDDMVVVPVYYRTMTPAYNAALQIDHFETSGYARVIDMHWT